MASQVTTGSGWLGKNEPYAAKQIVVNQTVTSSLNPDRKCQRLSIPSLGFREGVIFDGTLRPSPSIPGINGNILYPSESHSFGYPAATMAWSDSMGFKTAAKRSEARARLEPCLKLLTELAQCAW